MIKLLSVILFFAILCMDELLVKAGYITASGFVTVLIFLVVLISESNNRITFEYDFWRCRLRNGPHSLAFLKPSLKHPSPLWAAMWDRASAHL